MTLRQRRQATPVDRRPQHLPVPLGGMTPIHAARDPAWHRRVLRRMGAPVVAATGMAAAAASVVIVVTHGPTAVYLAGGRLHVGGSVLTAVEVTPSSTLFDGDAAYRLSAGAGGVLVGTAAWQGGGQGGSGACSMRTERTVLIETCRFSGPGAATTAVDGYDAAAGAWHRTYADGQQVTIAVPVGETVVPVPFPIGR